MPKRPRRHNPPKAMGNRPYGPDALSLEARPVAAHGAAESRPGTARPGLQELTMRRIGGSAAALGLVALLGGCSWANKASYKAVDGITNAGAAIGMPWGR